jgi:hypothetical protein
LTDPSEIHERLRDFLSAEIACEFTPEVESRVGCLMPLDYPSGDGITVWVEQYGDRLVVTDYGESLTDLLGHAPQDHKAMLDQVTEICAPLGVQFRDGRLEAESTLDGIADALWRATNAASRIAQASDAFQPKRRKRTESQFVAEVEGTFRQRKIAVERERRIEGQSGHPHRATIFLPQREAIVEPIGPMGNWNQISSVYTKFGDLSHANGFKLYSLVDDRDGHLEYDLANMLVQVSSVVQWSRREQWLPQLA